MIIFTLRSDVSKKVQVQQSKQKLLHDNTKPLRSFEVGDLVFVKPTTQMGTRESHQDYGTALLSS